MSNRGSKSALKINFYTGGFNYQEWFDRMRTHQKRWSKQIDYFYKRIDGYHLKIGDLEYEVKHMSESKEKISKKKRVHSYEIQIEHLKGRIAQNEKKIIDVEQQIKDKLRPNITKKKKEKEKRGKKRK